MMDTEFQAALDKDIDLDNKYDDDNNNDDDLKDV